MQTGGHLARALAVTAWGAYLTKMAIAIKHPESRGRFGLMMSAFIVLEGRQLSLFTLWD